MLRRGRLFAPRARWARVPGRAAEEGLRWNRRDQRTRTWWPQGIDVRADERGRTILVSWYARTRGRETATRVTVLRIEGRRARYHHVLLVEGEPDAQRPVAVHAGGIAWHGDRLLVADTFGGIRVFDLRDIVRVRRRRFAHRYLLPQSGSIAGVTRHGSRRLRYSFVSLEEAPDGPRLVVGEYRNDADGGRLARIPVDGDPGGPEFELHEPRIPRMQGACVVDGIWCLTTSEGTRRPGDLWVGAPGDLTRHRGVLPPGPEDLAREPGTRMLWSLSEQPGRRYVFRISLDRWAGDGRS
jgi:hypothetical protein